MRAVFILLLSILTAMPAHAGLTKAQLAQVRIDPPPNAAFPLSLAFRTSKGTTETLGEALAGKPGLIVFADYTCHTLCGPAIEMASAALAQSGLAPGRDFRLIAIGIDPKDSLMAAAAIQQRDIDDPNVKAASVFLSGDQAAIDAATEAMGYHYVYDAEHDQFAHPTAGIVVAASGRVSKILRAIGLEPESVRAALLAVNESPPSRLGTFLGLHCYGFEPLEGIYNASVQSWLQIGGIAFCMSLIATLISLIRRQNRRRAETAP